MSQPRSYDEVASERVAQAREAVDQADAYAQQQQAAAGRWLETMTAQVHPEPHRD